MSERTFDDKEMTGYFLPVDSQLLLAQVCNHIRFLARLAQPRIDDETQERAPEVRMSEWMFCLDQLAEQLDMVLQEVSWPARRTPTQEEAPRAEGAGVADSTQNAADGFVRGVSLDQVDRLNRLIAEVSAYGDAVSSHGMADFAGGTVTTLGHAVFDAASEMAEILGQLEAQRLEKGARLRFTVEEALAAYGDQAGPAAVAGHRPQARGATGRLRLH